MRGDGCIWIGRRRSTLRTAFRYQAENLPGRGCLSLGRAGSDRRALACTRPARARSEPESPTEPGLVGHMQRGHRKRASRERSAEDVCASRCDERIAADALTGSLAAGISRPRNWGAEAPKRGTKHGCRAPRITTSMGRWRRYWQGRSGLRARMTASYVLVTAAAVRGVGVSRIAITVTSA